MYMYIVNIRVEFGTGDIITLTRTAKVMVKALPFFHVFKVCETTSQFLSSAWESYKAYPEITKAFPYAAEHPFQMLQL